MRRVLDWILAACILAVTGLGASYVLLAIAWILEG